jgi:hypothetical protein
MIGSAGGCYCASGPENKTTPADALTRLSVVMNWIKRRRESRRLAAKHAAWRAELERLGVWAVQKRLDQAGAGTLVYGFLVGPIEREFVELWLGKKEQAAARQQAAILRSARIAAWASLTAAFFTLASLMLIPQAQTALRGFAASLRVWLDK